MVIRIPRRPEWFDDALCAEVGGDLWFVDKGESAAPAKAICALCAVRGPCLDYALRYDEQFGVWGGLTTQQRKRLKRKRAA